MKTTKLLTIVLAIAIIAFLMPTMTFANGHGGGGGHGGGHSGGHGGGYGHSNVAIGIGIGFPIYGGYGYWGGPYYYQYDYYPYYPPVVYAPPPYYPSVVIAQPVVVDQPVIVRREIFQPSYNSDLSGVRVRKAQLLNLLNQGGQAERLQAISELSGYSFDDQVRATLENLLLSDPNAAIREEVTVSFAKVKNRAALPILEKVRVEDSDREVRAAADMAINQIKS
jgi:hypothetical protein